MGGASIIKSMEKEVTIKKKKESVSLAKHLAKELAAPSEEELDIILRKVWFKHYDNPFRN